MPVYMYQCENCGNRFEAKQSFSDAPLTVCPVCGGKIHRLIQPAAVVFKGSGFYVNDSRGGKQNLATPGEKSEKADKKDAAPAAEGGSTSASGTGGESGSGESGGHGSAGATSTETAKPAAEKAAVKE